MAERLADIAAHTHAVRQVGAVVNAMRGLAGTRAQQGQALLPAIRAYADVSARAIAQALRLQPEADPPGAPAKPAGEGVLIVFGAQQGFAGAFADRVLNAVGPGLAKAHVMMVGDRSVAIARQRGLEPAWTIALPDRPASVAAMASELVDALDEHLSRAGPVKVELIVPVWHTGRGAAPKRRSLLPLDLARLSAGAGQVPLTTLPASVLLDRLAEEYVFAQVCEAAMEAYAAENQARVQAMAAAKTHIDTQLHLLEQREHQVRQDEITAEVIELAAAGRTRRS
jgi:F-type H+-transporting ATPase subunit gamma